MPRTSPRATTRKSPAAPKAKTTAAPKAKNAAKANAVKANAPKPKKAAKAASSKAARGARASAAKPAADKADFPQVFARLRAILAEHAPSLVLVHDNDGRYYLNSPKPWNKKELFFGAVQLMKSYVGFYLMPIYMNPALAKGLSPELTRRRQGKSCFNFAQVDEAAFEELRKLTRAGFEDFQRQGLV